MARPLQEGGLASYSREFQDRTVRPLVVGVQIIPQGVEQVSGDGDGPVAENLGFVAVHVEHDHDGRLGGMNSDRAVAEEIGDRSDRRAPDGSIVVVGLASTGLDVVRLSVRAVRLTAAGVNSRVGVVATVEVRRRAGLGAVLSVSFVSRCCGGTGERAGENAE